MEIRSVVQFLEYWDSLRSRTRRVVTCIPPERLEWTHRVGAFTLGDLVRHLATIERYMYAETVAGRASRYPGCGRELADGYDAVLAYLDQLDTEAKAIIGALSSPGPVFPSAADKIIGHPDIQTPGFACQDVNEHRV